MDDELFIWSHFHIIHFNFITNGKSKIFVRRTDESMEKDSFVYTKK